MTRKYLVSDDTYNLIRNQTLPGHDFKSTAVLSMTKWWEMPLDAEVSRRIEERRLPDENDDEVISRLVREATGQKPN